jgi:hypothetical protein
MGETMNESPKSHLHIPQLKKDIYVLNIIVQSLFGEKKMWRKRTPKEHPKP